MKNSNYIIRVVGLTLLIATSQILLHAMSMGYTYSITTLSRTVLTGILFDLAYLFGSIWLLLGPLSIPFLYIWWFIYLLHRTKKKLPLLIKKEFIALLVGMLAFGLILKAHQEIVSLIFFKIIGAKRISFQDNPQIFQLYSHSKKIEGLLLPLYLLVLWFVRTLTKRKLTKAENKTSNRARLLNNLSLITIGFVFLTLIVVWIISKTSFAQILRSYII